MATLWLVGMMGAGKTTIAPAVASALDMPWEDTDRLVEERTGETVEALFAKAAFRAAEREAVRSLMGAARVVACGGGVVLDDDLVAEMRDGGLVVWLDAPADVLAARAEGAHGRPLLGDRPGATLRTILEERMDRYRAAAHEVVDATRAPEAVVESVVEAWKRSS